MKPKFFHSFLSVFLLFIILVNYVSADTNFEVTLYQHQDKYSIPQVNDISYPSEDMLMKDMGITTEQYIQLLEQNAIQIRNGSVLNRWATSPRTGNVRIPVLLVEFADRNHNSYMTRELVDDIFNDPNYLDENGISVNSFYLKQSYGDLNVTFDVLDWRRLPESGASINYGSPQALGIATINLFNSTNQGPDTNFAQYDADNDGRIDGFIVIFASDSTGTPITYAGATGILNGYTGNPVDGKYLGNIAALADIMSGTNCTFGQAQTGITDCRLPTYLAAHEFAHVLGLPDLYATQGSTEGTPGLVTSFMDQPRCFHKPVNLDIWSRYFLGWVNPVTVTTESELTQTLRSINDYPDAVILRNNTLDENEFYIFENRYISTDTNNLDSINCMKYSVTSQWGLFNLATTYNVNGGILAYHVDENYINANYLLNAIMTDADGGYYNDSNGSHPGIVWEQNRIDVVGATNNSIIYNGQDFYTGEGVVSGGQTIYFKYFDNNSHYYTPDTTTLGYNLQANNISMEVTSPSGYSLNAIFKVAAQLDAPTTNIPSGNYVYGTNVQLLSSTPETSIYFTMDGTTPSQSSTLYTTPIEIDHNFTLKAIAYKANYYASDVATYNYTTTVTQNLILSFQFFDINSVSTIDNDNNTIITRVEFGTDVTNLTPIITIEEGCLINPGNVPQNFMSPVTYTVSSFSGTRIYTVYVIINGPAILPPVASINGGDYNSPQVIELTSPTPGTTIRYTLDGSEPNRITSLIYQNPITISSSTTLKAKAYLYVGQDNFSLANDSRSIVDNSRNTSNTQNATIQWYTSSTTTEYYIISILERQRRTTKQAPIQKEIIKEEPIQKIQSVVVKEK